MACSVLQVCVEGVRGGRGGLKGCGCMRLKWVLRAPGAVGCVGRRPTSDDCNNCNDCHGKPAPKAGTLTSRAPCLQVIDPRRERHSFVFFFYPSFDAAIPSLLPAAESEGAAGGVSGGGGGALGRYSLLASQVSTSPSIHLHPALLGGPHPRPWCLLRVGPTMRTR